MDMGLGAQNLCVETLVLKKIRAFDTQEILEGSCDVVALDDFRRDCHGALEALLGRLGVDERPTMT